MAWVGADKRRAESTKVVRWVRYFMALPFAVVRLEMWSKFFLIVWMQLFENLTRGCE